MVRQVLFNSDATCQERQTCHVRQSCHAVSHFGLRVLLILGLLCTLNGRETLSAEAQPTTPTTLPEVTVRGTTPLMSVPLPEKDIPVNVQVATDEDYRSSGALNLTDFLARDLAGVSLTQVQSNPFQPDVLYRGFTSSFLLGTPPGLSVFVDGARVAGRCGTTPRLPRRLPLRALARDTNSQSSLQSRRSWSLARPVAR